LAARRLVQRAVSPYSAADMGKEEKAEFSDETIVFLRAARDGMAKSVKDAVDAFGDGPDDGVYKHCVPYDRIFRTLESNLLGNTRSQCVKLLKGYLSGLGIDDGTGFDPLSKRIEFDAWFSWAFEAICDWPENIFRGPGSGDAGGTGIDIPSAPSSDLRNRLENAMGALNAFVGVNLDAKIARM
jgi:hypothetical protein